jgi:6-phosphogluconolactonase
MARETLLAGIPIPDKNIHRMICEKEPDQAAALHEREIRVFFDAEADVRPRFDLIFLGVGEDGHTASLFPGSNAESETERLVVAVYVERLRSYRLTLTLPVINAAANVAFLVSGESKSQIVQEILAAPGGSRSYPAAKVAAVQGQVTWFMTEDAAAGLPATRVPKPAI